MTALCAFQPTECRCSSILTDVAEIDAGGIEFIEARGIREKLQKGI